MPNLEPLACTESRSAVREFYSFHFGNEMKFSQDNLKLRERFLTTQFVSQVGSAQDGVDPFTTGIDDIPKAFRVGECKEISPERAEFQILLFWRDDSRSEQKEIKVEAAKQNETWLLDRIKQKHEL